MFLRSMRRGGAIGAATAAVLLAGALPASAAPGDGSAYAADVNVTLLGAPAVDLGPLAVSNTSGPTSATLASIDAPGILSTGVVTSEATLDEATGVVHSEAAVNNLGIALLGLGTIGVVTATCDATQAGNSGSAQLANAQLAGITIPVNPGPNTVIAVPPAPLPALLSITLNEQTANPDGSLTVNALHIRLNALLGTGDVVLASATCGPAAAPVPLASGAGLWVGLGLLAAVAVPVGIRVVRRRPVAV